MKKDVNLEKLSKEELLLLLKEVIKEKNIRGSDSELSKFAEKVLKEVDEEGLVNYLKWEYSKAPVIGVILFFIVLILLPFVIGGVLPEILLVSFAALSVVVVTLVHIYYSCNIFRKRKK